MFVALERNRPDCFRWKERWQKVPMQRFQKKDRPNAKVKIRGALPIRFKLVRRPFKAAPVHRATNFFKIEGAIIGTFDQSEKRGIQEKKGQRRAAVLPASLANSSASNDRISSRAEPLRPSAICARSTP